MDYQEALSEHNKRMRTDPMYRMLEMMGISCFGKVDNPFYFMVVYEYDK